MSSITPFPCDLRDTLDFIFQLNKRKRYEDDKIEINRVRRWEIDQIQNLSVSSELPYSFGTPEVLLDFWGASLTFDYNTTQSGVRLSRDSAGSIIDKIISDIETDVTNAKVWL